MSESGGASELPTLATAGTVVSLSSRGSSLLDELGPGVLIAEKYEIEQTLGRGAMGLVVAARHLVLNERVALKFLLLDDDAHHFRARFAREARVCAKLRNEHIVRVLDFGTWRESAVYMVMECFEGSDLRAVLGQRGPLDLKVAVEYAVQTCLGLAEVHAKGVVHRDLKPSNLFLAKRSDGSDVIKILDFGISKWIDAQDTPAEAELTETGALLGTPKFMAPEQLFGASVDARADVWSLGAIVYLMLTGKVPFEAPSLTQLCARHALAEAPEPPSAIRPDLPAAIDAALLGCLERNVERRTPNVAELAGDLLAAIGAPEAEAVRARLLTTLSTTRAVPGRLVGADASGSHVSAKSVPAAPSAPKASHARRIASIALLAALLSAPTAVLLIVQRTERSVATDERSPSFTPTSEPQPTMVTAPSSSSQSAALVATVATAGAPSILPAPSASGAAAAPKRVGPIAPVKAPSVVTSAPTPAPPPSTKPKPSLSVLLEDRQ